MTRWLVQIVAGLPPAIDGVGDYALTIARGLREWHAVETLFVVANPAWRGPRRVEGFPVALVGRKHHTALLLAMQEILAGARAGPATPVLFHCSLYGYARRALAFWLSAGFVEWRRQSPQSSWITMFHELAADGPIWSSPFWLRGFQSRIIRQFARESSASLTSNARYRCNLARIAGIEENRIVKLPVLSTVGEPAELPPLGRRKRQLVIFGRPASRDLAFSRCLPLLAGASLGIQRVLEVGPGPPTGRHGLAVPVDSTGALSPAEVSLILRESRFGLVALDASMLSKSSVFAAYCAHGMAPIVAGEEGGEADGLHANRQYLPVPHAGALGGDRLEAVAQAAHAWYREHGVAAQALQYTGILDNVTK